MQVLIIGGTGFIGVFLVKGLIQLGHEVTLFHRGISGNDISNRVQSIHGDRNKLTEYQETLRKVQPDVVIDVVPYTEDQARSLVSVFKGFAGHIVAVSSCDVYRNYDGFRGKATQRPDPVPLTEESPLRTALYPYRGYDLPFDWAEDYEKILVERVYLEADNCPATVLRLPAVFGPGDKQHRVDVYLRQMDEGHPTILLSKKQADWQWTRGYVEDIASAIAALTTAVRPASNVYNVGYREAFTEKEWVEHIGRAAGWHGNVEVLRGDQRQDELTLPFDWGYHLAISTSRIRSELGYEESFSLEEALAKTVAWERENRSAAQQ